MPWNSPKRHWASANTKNLPMRPRQLPVRSRKRISMSHIEVVPAPRICLNICPGQDQQVGIHNRDTPDVTTYHHMSQHVTTHSPHTVLGAGGGMTPSSTIFEPLHQPFPSPSPLLSNRLSLGLPTVPSRAATGRVPPSIGRCKTALSAPHTIPSLRAPLMTPAHREVHCASPHSNIRNADVMICHSLFASQCN